MATGDSLGYLADGWIARFEAAYARQLEGISGARPGSARGEAVMRAAVQTTEALVGQILRDITDPASGLFQAVAQACDPAVVERAAQAAGLVVTQANRRGRTRLAVAALALLSGLTGNLIGGAVEGASSALVGRQLEHTSDEDSVAPLRSLSVTCELLAGRIIVVSGVESGWIASSIAQVQAYLDRERPGHRVFDDRAAGLLPPILDKWFPAWTELSPISLEDEVIAGMVSDLQVGGAVFQNVANG